MKPTRTLFDWARTIWGSSRPADAAPTTAALRVRTRRRVVMEVSGRLLCLVARCSKRAAAAHRGLPRELLSRRGGGAQLETLDLPRRRLRQLGHERDPARVLVGCQLRLHVLLQVGLRGGLARLEHHV